MHRGIFVIYKLVLLFDWFIVTCVTVQLKEAFAIALSVLSVDGSIVVIELETQDVLLSVPCRAATRNFDRRARDWGSAIKCCENYAYDKRPTDVRRRGTGRSHGKSNAAGDIVCTSLRKPSKRPLLYHLIDI